MRLMRALYTRQEVFSVSLGDNKSIMHKGMMSFDLMIFMLGIALIIYLGVSLLAFANHRTITSTMLVSKYNWALSVSDYLVKFGVYDNDIFHDHEIADNYDNEILMLPGNVNVYTGALGTDIIGDADTVNKVCVTRYGVNKAGVPTKIIVCT